MILTVAIVRGFKNEITSRITGLTTHVSIADASRLAGGEGGPVAVSPDTLEALTRLPNVRSVFAVGFRNALLKTETENEGVLVKGVGRDYDYEFIREHLVRGRLPLFPAGEPGKEMLISSTLAQRLRLDTGDKVLLHFITERETIDSASGHMVVKSEHRSRKLAVSGIYRTGFSDYDARLCIADLRQLRRISYWPDDGAGSYEVRLHDFGKLDESADRIRDLLGFGYSVTTVRENFSNIFVWLDKLDVNGVIIVILMILVSVVNMITALLILILERGTMIGLVKSLGMSNRAVRRVFLRVSMRLTGAGLLWGNAAGIGLCILQKRFKLVGLNSDTYYVDHVAIDLGWGYFAALNAGTLVVCAVMLYLPTVIVTRMTPVRMLKFD